MKEKSYEELKSVIEARKKEIGFMDNRFSKEKSFRTKPRHPEEEEILVILALNHWRRTIISGEIVRLGPRRWRVET